MLCLPAFLKAFLLAVSVAQSTNTQPCALDTQLCCPLFSQVGFFYLALLCDRCWWTIMKDSVNNVKTKKKKPNKDS